MQKGACFGFCPVSPLCHFGAEYRKAPPPQEGKGKSMGIKRVAGLA